MAQGFSLCSRPWVTAFAIVSYIRVRLALPAAKTSSISTLSISANILRQLGRPSSVP